MDNIGARFGISYENNSDKSYLIIEIPEEEKLLSYQVEMIKHNAITGILPFDSRVKDGARYIYYNITSRITLKQYLSRKKLSRKQFIEMLLNISAVIQSCKFYLLDEKCLVFDDNYVYVDPGIMNIELVYLPVNTTADSSAVFRDYLINLIIYTASFDEKNSDNFLQRILNYLKSDSFNINELIKLLKQLKDKDADNTSCRQTGYTDDRVDLIGGNQEPGDNYIQYSMAGQNEVNEKNPVTNMNKISSVVNNQMRNENITSHTGMAGKKINKPGNTMRILLFQAAALIILVLGIGLLKSTNSDNAAGYAGLVIVVLAVDFLLVSKFAVADKSAHGKALNDDVQDELDCNYINFPIIDKIGSGYTEEISTLGNSLRQLNTISSNKSSGDAPNANQSLNTTVLTRSNAVETTILSLNVRQTPYLKSGKEGAFEEIPVSKASFIIGRLNDQVDHVCSNNAVGKVHAEIMIRDDGYYLKDLNSRNGTFINGVRIDSNKEYQIKNEDRLSFANSSYTFVIPA